MRFGPGRRVRQWSSTGRCAPTGVPSALAIYPQEGHGVRSYPVVIDFLTRAIDWFERWMPPNP